MSARKGAAPALMEQLGKAVKADGAKMASKVKVGTCMGCGSLFLQRGSSIAFNTFDHFLPCARAYVYVCRA